MHLNSWRQQPAAETEATSSLATADRSDIKAKYLTYLIYTCSFRNESLNQHNAQEFGNATFETDNL